MKRLLMHFVYSTLLSLALTVKSGVIAQSTLYIGHLSEISYCPAAEELHANCYDVFEEGDSFSGILEVDCSIAREDSPGFLIRLFTVRDTISQVFSAPYVLPTYLSYDITITGKYCAVNSGAWFRPNQAQTGMEQITGDPPFATCENFTAPNPGVEL